MESKTSPGHDLDSSRSDWLSTSEGAGVAVDRPHQPASVALAFRPKTRARRPFGPAPCDAAGPFSPLVPGCGRGLLWDGSARVHDECRPTAAEQWTHAAPPRFGSAPGCVYVASLHPPVPVATDARADCSAHREGRSCGAPLKRKYVRLSATCDDLPSWLTGASEQPGGFTSMHRTKPHR